MSDGKTHEAANLVVIGVTVALSTQLPLPLALGAIAGSVLGFLITPDIDHSATTIEEIRIYRWCGYLGGRLWQWFWRRYQRKHGHRSWFTHGPIIGTVGRWQYIVVRIAPLLAWTFYIWWHWWPAIYYAFLFNTIQDIVHLVLDGWRYHSRR